MAARTETRRNALLTVAAVLVGVVALNTVIDVLARSARIDLTQDRLYSTSKGVDRTLGTLVNLLIGSGFTLAHLDEWGPTPEQVDAMPALDEERDRPMLAIIAAQR